MNRDNRDRLFDVMVLNLVCQCRFLFVRVCREFVNKQCLSVEKVKKLHFEQMERDFGGLFVLFVTFVGKTVSRKIIFHKK